MNTIKNHELWEVGKSNGNSNDTEESKNINSKMINDYKNNMKYIDNIKTLH